ncbi:MAG: AAA family ATPase [Thermoleophilia bacterium]|nr:AAA family ATPase [Thermoleophilia bacterium]
MSPVVTEPTPGRTERPSLLPDHIQPEWNYEAEQAVLGGILAIPKLVDEIRAILVASDLYLPAHQRIFAAILALADQGRPIDPITVKDHLSSNPDVMAEGANYIWVLPQLSVPALHAPHHARVVKRLAQRRRMKTIGQNLIEGRLTSAEAQVMLATLSETEVAEALPTVTALDFCQQVPEEPDWILEGYLARGAITELDAKIKTGKTHFTTDLVRTVLAGEEFIGRRTLLTPVLYLTEERETTFRAALTRVGLDQTDGLHLVFRHQISLPWKSVGRAAIARAKHHGIGLVVIDTLSDWSGLEADMENDAGAALAAMRPLQEMASAGLAVLVLRHERKSGGEVGDSARGSSAFGGAADILLSLKKDPAGGQDNRRILEAVGRLEGWAPKLIIEMAGGHYRSLGTSTQVETHRALDFLACALPTQPDQALGEEELLTQADGELTRSTLKRVMKDLLNDGSLRRAKGAGSASSRAYGFWLDAEARL